MKLLLIISVSCCIGANFNAQPARPADRSAIIAGIKAGDKRSILEAGRTNDRGFVRYLHPLLRSKGKDRELILDARMSLAKLGEQDQLQAILCETADPEPYVQGDALGALRYIGGWYAVSRFREMLVNTPENRRFRGRGDDVLTSLSKQAVSLLEDLFPDGPKRSQEQRKAISQDFSDAEEWLNWINAHQSELKQQRPTGTYSVSECRASRK